MARECVYIAGKLGYLAVVSRIGQGCGSTDAARFSEAGIEATNLAGQLCDLKHYGDEGRVYHTRNDVNKHIEPASVEASLKMIREYTLQKDMGALLVR
jgi:hypothetical protein